jgi:hypothetical protein
MEEIVNKYQSIHMVKLQTNAMQSLASYFQHIGVTKADIHYTTQSIDHENHISFLYYAHVISVTLKANSNFKLQERSKYCELKKIHRRFI